MISLLLFWIGGVVLRFLFSWAFDPGFNVNANLKIFILSIVFGFAPAFIFYKMGLTNWTAFILLLAAGFMSQYVLEWLNKRKG